MSAQEIRVITRELALAAKQVTRGKAEIGLQPERLLVSRSGSAPDQVPVDHLYITLPAGRSGEADPASLAALEAQLDRIAARHGLKREPRSAPAGLVRFDYLHGRQSTHTVHIVASRLIPSVPRARPAAAQLAIIIDDLGYDRAAADALFDFPFPVTLAVLPHLPFSTEIAEEAHRRGYQVLLHLPMESSNGGAKPEAVELRAGMNPVETARLLDAMLDTVPHAVGVNNHQGSLASADPQLMAELMSALRDRRLFFIDSRTTTATVGYDIAVRVGVPAASRKVFLDDTPTVEAVAEQLVAAARAARRQGSTIAIGHPHPATLRALVEFVPQLEDRGIALVFASELVR